MIKPKQYEYKEPNIRSNGGSSFKIDFVEELNILQLRSLKLTPSQLLNLYYFRDTSEDIEEFDETWIPREER